MSVLLTGSTGMIGFRILTLLLEKGFCVRIAVRKESDLDRIQSNPMVRTHGPQMSSVIVPDITVDEAYDEAVKNMTFIIHAASPLVVMTPSGVSDDYYLRPSMRGTEEILKSAAKEPTVKKVVITSSISALCDAKAWTDPKSKEKIYINENSRNTNVVPPFSDDLSAYAASKARALQTAEEFVQQENPSFSVIHIMPSFVWGRDNRIDKASELTTSTNSLLMSFLLGWSEPSYLSFPVVHLDDVAKIHLLALDKEIKGHENFMITSADSTETNLAVARDIVRRNFARECKQGVFPCWEIEEPAESRIHIDCSKAELAFNIQWQSFEDMIVSVVGQYLELTRNN